MTYSLVTSRDFVLLDRVGDGPEAEGAVPERQDRYLVHARALDALLGDLLRVPVALEVHLVVEDGDLHEAQRVVLRADERPRACAVLRRGLRGRRPGDLELVAAERVRHPVDDDHRQVFARAQAHTPTSA